MVVYTEKVVVIFTRQNVILTLLFSNFKQNTSQQFNPCKGCLNQILGKFNNFMHGCLYRESGGYFY